MIFDIAIFLSLTIALAYGLVTCFLALQCLLGLRPSAEQNNKSLQPTPKRTIVLMPAHNEEAVIRETISSLHREIGKLSEANRASRDSDDTHQIEFLLVADNCVDQTAQLARDENTTVIERKCNENRGKGFALAHGIQHLESELVSSPSVTPPDVVVVLDADCTIQGLRELATECYRAKRVLQSTYLMQAPAPATLGQRISAFSVRLKNQVRLRGLKRLGGASLLTGSGMAFPWESIRSLNWGGAEIVEDLATGLRLIESGEAPVLFESATVLGQLPSGKSDASSQRRRWEHGFLNQMIEFAPRLLAKGLLSRNWKALLAGMDMCIPPLSLFGLGSVSLLILLFVVAMTLGSWTPFLVALTAVAFATCSLTLAWYHTGRRDLDAKSLLGVPLYVINKLSIYASFFVRRETNWTRTSRT